MFIPGAEFHQVKFKKPLRGFQRISKVVCGFKKQISQSDRAEKGLRHAAPSALYMLLLCPPKRK